MHKCMYDLYDENFNYLGQAYCALSEVRNFYKEVKYFMAYNYFTRRKTHFVDVDNVAHWEKLR